MPAPMDFIHKLKFDDLPAKVVEQAKLCLVDLIGAAAAGSETAMSRIIRDHAVETFGARKNAVRLMLDGRKVGPAGAAMAGGITIDAFDSHDGHVLTKGHAGVAILPTLLALADPLKKVAGREFLTSLVIGYEIAIRAGIATHRTAKDYHTSGSWNSLGAAAVVARWMKLSPALTREALGIAEYHGPRSQMMRCIDFPTMVKDGSGWGAMAGVSAALLAKAGFTGAPALVWEGADVADLWRDLGKRWRIMEMYFKPYPVCRWAQPPITASLGLLKKHGIKGDEVTQIEVSTFHNAVRLATRTPKSTEEAQYSLPFPVAAAIVHGKVTAREVDGKGLTDPRVLKLARGMKLTEDLSLTAEFPARRIARVALTIKDGRVLKSDLVEALGDPERPLGAAGIVAKYRETAEAVLGKARTEKILAQAMAMDGARADARALVDLVLAPVKVQKPATTKRRAAGRPKTRANGSVQALAADD
ncbi:MAG: MmgE/PrpD family protein [Rhodospirillaceae bacterium]|nr:MmgE/PrpD family protein [Rhodospirillaceae bacterium]